MPNVIEVNGLTKRFASLTAVNDVSFHVEQGEIFGLLGKNGAGKTTTVEILEGYQSPDEGRVQVLGVDPKKGGGAWKDRIGLVLQDSDFDPSHTVTETVKLFAGFFSHPKKRRRDARTGRSHRQGEHADRSALGRAAAPRRRGVGHRRVAGAVVPGRADDRFRPVGASRVLDDARRPALEPARRSC